MPWGEAMNFTGFKTTLERPVRPTQPACLSATTKSHHHIMPEPEPWRGCGRSRRTDGVRGYDSRRVKCEPSVQPSSSSWS
jgi:hypothetical protein